MKSIFAVQQGETDGMGGRWMVSIGLELLRLAGMKIDSL